MKSKNCLRFYYTYVFYLKTRGKIFTLKLNEIEFYLIKYIRYTRYSIVSTIYAQWQATCKYILNINI